MNTKTVPDLIKPTQLTRVVALLSLLDEYRRSDETPRAFALSRGIPPSTFQRHLRGGGHGPMGLIDRRSMGCGRPSAIGDDVLTWVFAFLAQHRRATLRGAHRAMEEAAPTLGWQAPKYSTLAAAVKRIPLDAREVMVSGSKAAFEKWGLVRTVRTEVPNELWQMDATELPVWCLDTSTGESFKPWAIGILDTASRVVMGLFVLRKEPCSADVLVALRSAILPKDDDRFPFFGRPSALQTDNGAIFKSADFLDALLRMGIDERKIRNDCPGADGKVERFFRTVQEGLCRHLVQYSEQHRGLATAKRTPLPFPVVQQLVDKFLVDYHLRVHRTLNSTPWQIWHDRLIDAAGFDIVAGDVVDACRVRMERKVQRNGIELGAGRHFSSPDLAGLVGENVVLRVIPDGDNGPIPCYYRGKEIGSLERVEGNQELGQRLRAARLDRAKELSRLRKALLKTASRFLPERPMLMPPGSKTIVTPPPTQPEETAPMEIPDLEDEEDA